MTTVTLALMTLLMSGCARTPSICPSFPVPSNEAIQVIRNVNSPALNEWVVELFKLNKKLELCNDR